MLFLVKRSWRSGMVALGLLTALGVVLRYLLPVVPPLGVSWQALLFGIILFMAIFASDVTVHALLVLLFGVGYRARHRELVTLFKGQSPAAMAVGALLAGVGEELLFRGLGTDLRYVALSAVAFALLHHVRRSLWPFTIWAGYQSCLLSAGVLLTGSLFVAMVAHFLHDLAGFLVFRYLNRTTDAAKNAVARQGR
jgi:membrane protease YdiL (CAAX protease family)